MADAAGPAGDQRFQLRRQAVPDQEPAGPLWPEQSFMAGERQRVGSQIVHTDRQDAGGLGRVQDEADPAGAADGSDLCGRQDRPADVARVEHNHGFCRFFDLLLQIGRVHGTVRGAGNAGKPYALLFQLAERTHHRVMLQGGNQYVVSRPEQPLQQDVQAFGNVLCEDDVFRVRDGPTAPEQPAEKHARIIDKFLRGIGPRIAAAAGVASAFRHKAEDGLRRARGFGETCAGLVQVDLLHGLTIRTPAGVTFLS